MIGRRAASKPDPRERTTNQAKRIATAQRGVLERYSSAYVWNRRVRRGAGRAGCRGRGSAASGIPRLRLAGVALVAGERLHVAKKAGKLGNLEKVLAEEPLPHSGLGIGHTRWATHGGPNDVNAHPHTSADGRIALVHNGIIENYLTLRDELEAAGISCQSETDTEIVAQLLGQQVGAGLPLEEAMGAVCRRLRGAFTLVAVDSQQPDMVVAARAQLPPVVGVGQGENFVASDVAAFIEHTREAIELGQDQLVRITPDMVEVTTFDGQPGGRASLPRRLGSVCGREGWLRLVHAQGDLRAAACGRRHAAGPP